MDYYGSALWTAARWIVGAWAVLVFLRWILTPPHWRDGEGPLVDEGERMATEFSRWRWLIDRFSLRFWRW